jgi:hypothetical protein
MRVRNFKETKVYKLATEKYISIFHKTQEIGRLLGHMINNPDKY